VHNTPIEAENSGVGFDPIARCMVAGMKTEEGHAAAAASTGPRAAWQRQGGDRGLDQDATDLDAWNLQRFLSVRLQRSAARAPRIGTGPGTAAAL